MKRAFRYYAENGHSLKSLAGLLWKEGYRSRKGQKIPKQTLYDILRNPVYIGLIRVNGRLVEGTHQPLIGKALFEKVQKRLSENGHPHPGRGKEFYFKGLAKCGYCG